MVIDTIDIVADVVGVATNIPIKKTEEEIKEEVNSLSSEEIRTRIKYNKKFNPIGREIITKRKDLTGKEIWGDFFDDILTFPIGVLLFGIIFMGALGIMIGVPPQEFLQNTTEHLASAANITLTTFYDIGYESKFPMMWFYLFYFAVFMAFILPTIILIKRFVQKWRKKHE